MNIKSAVSNVEIEALQHLALGKRTIEIGSLLGFSTIRLAQVSEVVESIDPHEGYPFYRPASTLREFRYNLEKYNTKGNVRVHVGTAQQRLMKLDGDLTFIDCTGFYEDTKFCLENGKGILACHDFGRRGCEDIEKVVNEFVEKTRRKLEVVETLAIIR